MPNAPGDQIADWVLDRPIGRGGMGEVWLAHSVVSERLEAAIKVLRTDRADARTRARFVREIEALARLNHPAVVRVLGWGEHAGGLLYLAMERVHGKNIFQRLNEGPIPESEILPAMAQFAAGLAHAHEGGLAHRDIKPTNLMLGADGRPRILDFGIVLDPEQTRLTGEGMVTGTGPYLAPEALDGETYNPHQGDIYALGVVLYEALTCKAGFRFDAKLVGHRRILQLLEDKRKGPLDPGDKFSDAIREVVGKATHPNPSSRYARASQMEHELLAITGPIQPVSHTLTPAPRVQAMGPKPSHAKPEQRDERPAVDITLALFVAGFGATVLAIAMMMVLLAR